ncbi:Amidohydrolase [Paenibacillus konkukensis]|uniref:Amidohydrolase n=1 Tax=Paenibacillus konkukensis TaxID=2020716 RepID=A0ABY4RFW9_9BACL|nr:amidohydrolase family protein [Paenibacillus konkukensis]UQZ81182.1 Amidohydrolase [Paenibacillus konkukensis]
MYLDSHVHFWRPARGDYGWLKPDNSNLYRDFTPEQLLPHLTAGAVRGCIAVQAAPTDAETDELLSLADDHPWIVGVVGSLDPFAAEAAYAARYERLRERRRFSGVRLGGEQLERIARCGGEAVRRLRRWAEDRFAVDLLVRAHQLEHVLAVMRQAPELHAAVNHLGGPPYGDEQGRLSWERRMSALALYPNVMVKISGMLTSAGNRPELLRPYAAHLLEAYGPDRLMFGSDWPVATQNGGYRDVLMLFEQVLPAGLTERERSAVRFDSARRFYRISEAR